MRALVDPIGAGLPPTVFGADHGRARDPGATSPPATGVGEREGILMSSSRTSPGAPLPGAAVQPEQVHSRLAEHLLVDGYPFVLDLEASHGSWLVDRLTGRSYLDLYTFFASSPLG